MKEWAEIPNTNSAYSASPNGGIKSNKRYIKHKHGGNSLINGKILKPQLDKKGCPQVGICINGISKHKYISRLVALTFIPNPKNLPFVCHKDDNPLNNNVGNLFWGTHQDNMDDMNKKGRGSLINRKLNEEQVREIKSLLKQGISHPKICVKFNVCRQVIGLINTGKTYKAIA